MIERLFSQFAKSFFKHILEAAKFLKIKRSGSNEKIFRYMRTVGCNPGAGSRDFLSLEDAERPQNQGRADAGTADVSERR